MSDSVVSPAPAKRMDWFGWETRAWTTGSGSDIHTFARAVARPFTPQRRGTRAEMRAEKLSGESPLPTVVGDCAACWAAANFRPGADRGRCDRQNVCVRHPRDPWWVPPAASTRLWRPKGVPDHGIDHNEDSVSTWVGSAWGYLTRFQWHYARASTPHGSALVPATHRAVKPETPGHTTGW